MVEPGGKGGQANRLPNGLRLSRFWLESVVGLHDNE